MRSTATDMIGMTLMALWVLFTTGVMLVGVYRWDSRRQGRSRSPRKERPWR
jgi:hypothetical protein